LDLNRRLVLKGGLAAGSLFLPLPYAWVWAQSEGTIKVLRAPKLALVLGNSRYKDAPLKNPANDARTISDALKASGFDVTLRMDAGKADMAAAVQAYVQSLATRKCVGLFYYAGHGIQLAWRNYMLPVDADVDTIGDIQKQGVELNALMEGLTKAANPLNIVILDACRDNPFGNLKGIDHKGLSQMDAPHNSIISYATAPGNVASDGDGANGLYTESLLREVKAKEVKIEDVFKRVRLNVRLKSKGAQIPWDSSSLEDDFYFMPPDYLKKLAETENQREKEVEREREKERGKEREREVERERHRQAEREREREKERANERDSAKEKERHFKEELALWESIKSSTEVKPFADYIQKYPNGNYAELAQLELDRALAKQGEKKIEIAPQAGNPFTKGSAEANTSYKIGDTYTTRILDPFSRVEQRRVTVTVTQITAHEVIFDGGEIRDLLGNPLKFSDGRRVGPN
jgi:hypothetical protein